MAESWDADDDDLERLLDFDDLEVQTVPKSCKALPSVDTKEAETKYSGEPQPLKSSNPYATGNTQIGYAYSTPIGKDLDGDGSSHAISVQGTSVIASRLDKVSATTDLVRSKTLQLDTQPTGLDNEYFRERNGAGTGQDEYVNTQRTHSVSVRGKLAAVMTNDRHRRGDTILTGDNADVLSLVEISDVAPAVLDKIATIRPADHASEERTFPESAGIRGRQKGCSSLQVDKADADVEIVPDASVGQGVELNLSDKTSHGSISQPRQAMVDAQTQGAARLGSKFRESGTAALLQKNLNSFANVDTAVENPQLLSLRDMPFQAPCTSQKGDTGAYDKRTTVQREAGSPERGRDQELLYRIPGPAGAFQKNFRKRTSDGTLKTRRRSLESGSQSTTEFVEGPWISAMDYLNGGAPKHLPTVTIGTVKSLSRHNEHIPELVALVKAVVPNGFGDVSVVLKDPTGTINGCIHRSVLTESKYGHGIVPGTVLVLRKVTVFSPNPYAHYLNITMENVHKVFGSEVGSSRPQTRAAIDKVNNAAGNKLKSLQVSQDDSKELQPDLADITQGIRVETGVRNSTQQTKSQRDIRHDVSHVNPVTEYRTSPQEPECADRTNSPPNANMATTLDRTEDEHLQLVGVNLGIRGDTTRDLFGVQYDTQNNHVADEKATQEAVVAAKAKAAGWDFGEDVELLLNDDLGNFIV